MDSTWLRGRRATALSLLAWDVTGFAMEIHRAELDEFWTQAGQIAERPPLVVVMVGRDGDWIDAVRTEDFFSRLGYTYEPGGEPSPAAILRDADTIDVPAFLLQLDILRRQSEMELGALSRRRDVPHPLPDRLAAELDGVQHEFGTAPRSHDRHRPMRRLDALRVTRLL